MTAHNEKLLAELQEGGKSVSVSVPPTKPGTGNGFSYVSLENLMTATENVRWLVDDMLTVGGLSIVVAKPKAGKSTLARCLALAVARGGAMVGPQRRARRCYLYRARRTEGGCSRSLPGDGRER